MYSLKEIRDYQEQEYERINELAQKIHPKLLGRLSFNDLFNDDFNAELYEKQYNELIRPEVIKYRTKLKDMLNDHLVKFIQGWAYVHPENRWAIRKSDGTTCTAVDWCIIDNFNDYILDTEIDDYCELVNEMLDDYKIRTFWSQNYTLYGNGYRKNIGSANSAVSFIKNNRNLFSGYKSNFEVLEKLAQDSTSLPFKMLLPPVNNNLANALRNDEFQKCVKHHRVLHSFFEIFGKNAPNGTYNSREDDKGEITFWRNDLDL